MSRRQCRIRISELDIENDEDGVPETAQVDRQKKSKLVTRLRKSLIFRQLLLRRRLAWFGVTGSSRVAFAAYVSLRENYSVVTLWHERPSTLSGIRERRRRMRRSTGSGFEEAKSCVDQRAS